MVFIGCILRILLWPHAVFFLSAHLAFISVESFFRMAELIGLCLTLPVNVGLLVLWSLRFRFAHHAFFAAPILARAAALM
jgi:hypothetical protein